jgi:hypothetical protein
LLFLHPRPSAKSAVKTSSASHDRPENQPLLWTAPRRNHKRSLTLAMIRRLHADMGIPAEVLLGGNGG